MPAEMPPALFLQLESSQPREWLVGWVVAALLAIAWIATSLIRARSRLRLERTLQEDAITGREESSFPLLEPIAIASTTVRQASSGLRCAV